MDLNEEIRDSKRDDFLSYLLSTSMSPDLHIPCFRKVMSCRTEDSVPNIMRRLSTEGFTSAPVLSTEGNYEGFVDMLDLVKFVSNMFWGADETIWIDFWEKEIKFQRAVVGDVMGNRRFRATPLMPPPLFQDNSTMHALELMVTGNHHRLVILNNPIDRNMVGIFTQSMLISELTQRLHMLGDLRFKKVQDLGTAFFSFVTSVKETDKAINAFNIMSQQDISGLAVVDENGTLNGAISITDLRSVGANGQNFSRLFKSVREFKRHAAAEFPRAAPRMHASSRPTPTRGLYISPNHTFEDVIRMMADGNIHRVFVCSVASINQGAPKPLHVITQTDMLKYVWKHYTFARKIF